jgi:hypothetical protein
VVTGGVTAPAGSANIKVNGSPATTYRVLLDGQDITNSNEDPSHTLEQQPAVEALQEFTLQSSNFSAEFGQITGGLFNFTTKSGTNGLHGVAFTFVKQRRSQRGQGLHHFRQRAPPQAHIAGQELWRRRRRPGGHPQPIQRP